MPPVKWALWVVPLLASCALPPRVEDRSDPVAAYRTFRGALARDEIAREWDCLSDGLRGRLGFASRAEWEEARRIVLGPRHAVIRGIRRSKERGEPHLLPDGRALLDLRFPFGIEGKLVLRRVFLLRVFADGQSEPFLYDFLPRLQLLPGKAGLTIPLPAEWRDDVLSQIGKGRAVDRIEARGEWFLDDFSVGDDSPSTVRDTYLQTKDRKR